MNRHFFQAITTTCLVGGALVLTGCGSDSTTVGETSQNIIEFSQQPIEVNHVLIGSTSNAFDLALKDQSGNAVSQSGTVNLALISTSNIAYPAGQATMTNGIVDDATITFTGAPGIYRLGVQLVNEANTPQTTIFVSNPMTLVQEAHLSLAIQNQPTLNADDNTRFSTSAQFVATVNGTIGTTPVHGVNKDVTLEVVTGAGSVLGTNPIQSTNGVVTFTDYRVSEANDYTFRFTSTINGSASNSATTNPAITINTAIPI